MNKLKLVSLAVLLGLVSCNSEENSLNSEEASKFINEAVSKDMAKINVETYEILSYTVKEVSTYEAEGADYMIEILEDGIAEATLEANKVRRYPSAFNVWVKYRKGLKLELEELKSKIKNNPVSFRYDIKVKFLAEGSWHTDSTHAYKLKY